jgi:hypothetical protein
MQCAGTYWMSLRDAGCADEVGGSGRGVDVRYPMPTIGITVS